MYGLANITDRSDATLWLCALLPSDSEYCRTPSAQEIAADPSVYGGQLSQDSKNAATSMALNLMTLDCSAHPELYTQLPGSCSYQKPGPDYTGVAVAIAGVALLLLFGGR